MSNVNTLFTAIELFNLQPDKRLRFFLEGDIIEVYKRKVNETDDGIYSQKIYESDEPIDVLMFLYANELVYKKHEQLNFMEFKGFD